MISTREKCGLSDQHIPVTYKLAASFFLFLFLIKLAVPAAAQQTFGVEWHVPESQDNAIEQLRRFHKMGISILEVHKQPSNAVWDEIERMEFMVYGNLDIRFPTTTTFAYPDSSFIHVLQTNASSYLNHPGVEAIGLFEHGAFYDSTFQNAVLPFANQLSEAADELIYFKSNQLYQQNATFRWFILYDLQISPENFQTFSLPNDSNIIAYEFSTSKTFKGYLRPFKHFLNLMPASQKKAVIIDDHWLKAAVNRYPQFSTTLHSLATDSNAVFPVPDESLPAQHQSNALPIGVLLLVWASIALFYHSSPLYRKSVFRYFNGHKFFINDILKRHIRSPFPAFLIIIHNALLNAAAVYATFSCLFAPRGQEAFFYHFSALQVYDKGRLSLFFGTLLLLLTLSIISIIWLYISHRRIKIIVQMAIIYAWPLQLNYIVATVAIIVFSAGGNAILVTTFTLLTIVITLLSFIMASSDTARFVRRKRWFYILVTSGLYLLLWGGVFIGMLLNDSWGEGLSLSLHLR